MHRISLDAMGGDGAPAIPIEGALAALRDWPGRFEITLIGHEHAIRTCLPDPCPDGLRVVPATQVIDMSDHPVQAVRRKRDSSIVVGLTLLREGQVDAFVSAGSTGAIMTASLFLLGVMPGVERPTVGAMFPTATEPTLVLDAGANINTRPAQLLQFAHLGTVYMRDLRDLERPRVGLLNVGEEAQKGDELALSSHELLSSDPTLHFIGNVEGHQIIEGVCDVLVCDGFVGNVLLKFYESVAAFLTGLLREATVDAGCAEGLEGVFRLLDYTEYGGAPLLGVNGVSVICHGSSPPNAIKNAIRVAAQSVETGVIRDMTLDLRRLEGT